MRISDWSSDVCSSDLFGVNQDPKGKADGDFAKSVKGVDAAERKDMTFVFVTPRSWAGKESWVKDRKKEKLWKHVRAYDASDLEQWLEQSIRSEEHTSELQSLMRNSYAVFCLKKKTNNTFTHIAQ